MSPVFATVSFPDSAEDSMPFTAIRRLFESNIFVSRAFSCKNAKISDIEAVDL